MTLRASSSSTKSNLQSASKRYFEKLFAVRWFKKLSLSWQASIPAAIAIVLLWNVAAIAQNALTDAAKVAQDVKDLRVGVCQPFR